MALQFQTIPISLQGGVDTKTDAKMVIAGKLTNLENGRFNKSQSIQKENGYDALSTSVTSGEDLVLSGVNSGLGVFKPGNNVEELVQFGGAQSPSIYSYSPNIDKWVNKGQAFSVGVSSQPLTRTYSGQGLGDSGNIGSIRVFTNSSLTGAEVTVIDNDTGVQHLSGEFLGASITAPRVVTVGGFIYVVYGNSSGDIVYRKLDPATPGTFAAEVTLVSDLYTSLALIDTYVDGSVVYMVYRSSTGDINLKKLDSSMTITASTSIVETPNSGLCVVPSTNVFVYWKIAGVDTRYAVFDSSLSTVLAATNIYTGGASIGKVIAYPTSSTTQTVFFEEPVSVPQTNMESCVVMTAEVDTSGVTSTASELIRSMGIVSKAFSFGGRVHFIGVYNDYYAGDASGTQPTYFCVRSSGSVIAKIFYGAAGGSFGDGAFSRATSVNSISASKFYFLSSVITDANIQVLNLSRRGMSCVEIDFDSDNQYNSAMLGGNLHTVGGFLSIYDGVSVVEHGFHLVPEKPVLLQQAGGGIADGTYQYAVVYEWIDNTGQIHRSAPSVPVSITISGGGGTATTRLYVPTLRITDKVQPRPNVGIQIYRTTASGTVFHNISNDVSPTNFNDTTVDYLTIDDVASDSYISNNELLYTTGGVLDNMAVPSCRLIDVYDGRIVVAGLDDPLEFRYSKAKVRGEGVAFAEEFQGIIDPLGGGISSVKLMDDKILLFKENNIFYVSGQGPNDTGEATTYSNPQLVTSDVGCPYPNSLVLTPEGVMFKSNKGIYLINRSLQVSYVGADVEAYNSQNITAATLLQTKNQVRYLTDSGTSLFYDYFFKQWTTKTNHLGNDAVIHSGVYKYLRTDGTVYSQSDSNYQDASTNQQLKIVTAWLKLSGIQSFQRVRRFAILGTYYSAHTLRVRVYYDYDDTSYDEYTFDATTQIGSTSVPYQFRGLLKRQKCEAIKFEIVDTGATLGRTYDISDLSVEVGLKGGINRLKATRSI